MTATILPHLYEMIATEAMFGIVVFDQQNHCLFSNKVSDQLLGKSKPELSDLYPAQDRPPFVSFNEDLLKHEGLYQDILVKNQNSYFIANIGIKHFTLDGVSATAVMLQDVTLQKKLQREITAKQNEIHAAFEELLKQNNQLKELDVAKNRFIALTTHELRTPLSAMVASAEILKLELYDTPEQMREFIGMIYEQGMQLQELVNDILDFAKIQAGKMDFYIEQHDVASLARMLASSFSGMAESNQVEIVCEEPTAPLTCYYDSLRLRQVLSNIVNNAIKYNRPQGQVIIRFERSEDLVKVFVQDTGKGIPADQMDKVFNEFETIGQVAQHHKGTGLGMPISRKLAEGMGIKLLLDSKEGVGSTFWVEIPTTKVLAENLYQPRPGSTDDLAA